MKNATLVFLVKPGMVLLGMKKRGFGAGKWNGIGGKVGYNEEIKDAAVREVWEECLVHVKDVERVAQLSFSWPMKPEWDQLVHVFVAKSWDGFPTETEEVRPAWFDTDGLPYKKMWADDPHWLPKVLKGERIRAKFVFASDNETVQSVEMGTL
jgi:8-oxo-dGTP pyrophosphatase MutT (NUDIX family)